MDKSTDLSTRPNFYGAAIVEDDGSETPITEEMIVRACRELEGAANPAGRWPELCAN